MRPLASKRILPHACFLASRSTYFPFESVVGALVKSSVTRDSGREKGAWWKERGRQLVGSYTTWYILRERPTDIFKYRNHSLLIFHEVGDEKTLKKWMSHSFYLFIQKSFVSIIMTWSRAHFSFHYWLNTLGNRNSIIVNLKIIFGKSKSKIISPNYFRNKHSPSNSWHALFFYNLIGESSVV